MAKSKIAGLTVEIGGNTTKLGKALSGVDSKARATSSELREVNNALKKAPESVELWNQKQKLLTEAIENSREKLAKLEEVQKDIQRQYDNGDIGEDAYRAYQREVEKTKGELEGFEKQLEKTNEDMKEAGKQADDTGDSLEAAGDKAEESGGKFPGMAAAAVAAAAVITKAASECYEAWQEVDEGYDTIVTKTGATGAALEELQGVADNIFTSLPVEMSDVGNAVGEVNTRFQLTGEALEGLSSKFLKYADINSTDVVGSVDNVSGIMKAFNLDVAEAGDLLGVLTDVGQRTGLEVSQLESLLLSNAATFKEMGLDVAAAAEMLGQFEINGVEVSQAIAGLTKAQQNATKDGKSLNDALAESVENIKSAATETEALQIATDLFGKKGAAPLAQAIREGRVNFDEFSKSMKGAGDLVDSTFDAIQDAPDRMKATMNSLKLQGAELAEKLLPQAEKLLEQINDNLPEILDTGKRLLPVVGGLATAAAGISTVDRVKKALPAIKSLETAFTAASSSAAFLPVTIAAVAGALIVGGMSYVTATEEARQAHLEEVFEKATEKTNELTGKIYGNIDAIKAQKDAAAEKIEADEQEIKKIQALREELDKLTDKNGVVKEGYEERVRYITEELGQATGIEIEYIDGQIQKYDELKQSLDDVIDKKRAESMASAYESIYQEAIRQNEEAADSLQALKEDISANQYEIDKLYRDAKREAEERNVSYGDFGEFSYANIMKMQKENLDTWSTLLNEAQLEKLYAYEQNIRSAQEAQEALHDSFALNQSDIESYEEAFKAMTEGNYREAQSYYNRIGNLDLVALRRAENNIDQQKRAFTDGVNAAIKRYNNALELGDKNAKKTFTETITALTNQGREGGLTIGDLLSTGIVDQLNTIDGFDDSGLQEFARIAGWNFGDNFGTEAAEASAQAFLAAESISERVSGTMARLSSLPFFASGGFLASGQGIVAEAGPELLEVMNGGVRITPLTRDARNTPVQTTGGGAGSSTKIYNNYISATIKGSYDVYKLAEDMSTAERIMDNAKGV
jgi:phage-related minor tail protein